MPMVLPRIAALLVVAAPAALAEVVHDQAPPFITTPGEVVTRMLQLADTGPQDYVIDLGSGDGRIVIAAAREFGAQGLGLEIDASLVAQSRRSAERAGVAARTDFRVQDVLTADLSRATVVTMYLLPNLIDRLQPRFLAQLRPGTRIVSHSFPMIGWKPDRVETVRLRRSHSGQGDESRLYLWRVPADVRGEWRGRGPDGEWRLHIQQNFQELDVQASLGGRPVALEEASLSGASLSWRAGEARYRGRIESGRILGELARGEDRAPLVLLRNP
jgi:protein-L-isoaspartate O-methyltransferase